MQPSRTVMEAMISVDLSRLKRITMCVLTLSLIIALSPVSYGQDNGKSPEEKARQDSIKYQLELAKNWSFGWENYKNKQYKDVARYFWKVIELDTTHRFKKVYHYLGQTYFQLSLPDSAQLVYEKGLAVMPEDASLRRNLAYIFTGREQVEEAVAEYEKIRELGAATEDDLNRVANLYIRTDQNDKAIETYEAILKINPQNEEARNTLSQLYHVSGDEDKMLENMEKTLLQNPEDTQTMYRLAKARYDREEFEIAIDLLEKYEALEPKDALALELKANAQQNLGNYQDAINSYEKIVALKPNEKKALVNIGTCYRELGKYVQARSYANKALAIDGKYGYAQLLIGRIYESAADDCSSKKGKSDFSDKLVYEKAYNQYQLATNDLDTRSEARSRLQYLESSRPTNEDYFMNKNQKEPEGDCYKWLR